MHPGLRIARLPITHPDAARLVDEVQAEYAVRYGSPDETPIDPSYFDEPDGAFFVGYLDDEPVATGAWRRRTDVEVHGLTKSAELKRMYVRASARRRGLAREMLAHLEDTARLAGAEVMILETGMKQPEAIELYTSAGYRTIRAFGHYRDSPLARSFAKRLVPAQ